MRPRRPLLRSAAAGFVAAVLLTACGGSGDEEPAAGSSTTSSSSAASSSAAPTASATPDPAAAEFCSQVTSVFQQVATAFQSATPDQVPGLLQEVVAAFDTVQPPPDIAADWQALGGALRELQSTAGSLDLSTPEGQQQYADAEARLTQQVAAAQQSVTGYVLTNCGGVPSPTS